MNTTKTLFGDETETVRALSWNQPYASLMLHGKIETRTRPTKVRGKVLICSCKKRYTLGEIAAISGREQSERMNNTLIGDEAGITGQAIAIADLVDCRQMTYNDQDKCFVEFSSDRWCWIFENVQPIEPFPFKGKQGWSIISDDVKKQIKILSTKNIGQIPDDPFGVNDPIKEQSPEESEYYANEYHKAN